MYVNIPVRQETKETIDEFRKVFGTKSYDETLKELTKANSFKLIEDLEGIIAGAPKFERDKRVRNFG